MSDPEAVRAFLLGEVEGLGPFDFVAAGPAGSPLHVVEVTRLEDGSLEVRVPGRPRTVPALDGAVRGALRERGFRSEDPADPTLPWSRAADDAAEAVGIVQGLFTEAFGEKPDLTLDVVHGSHRYEHEVRQKLAVVRRRIERVLTDIGGRPPQQDEDEDYVLPMADVHVMVAPRATPGGPIVVRVFAVCTVGVNVVPELGLFLARLNFSLMFGRFALDTEHQAIWFDETLLGQHLTDDELHFAINVVASTADQWDDRLKQMFGGATYQEVLKGRSGHPPPPTKPGEGGYV